MSQPTLKTAKTLFAKSGNRCAYMDCPVPLVEDNNCVTGEICHIRAFKKGEARYDASQTDAQRNAPENLILMCARHHKIIDDDPTLYSVAVLTALKRERESVGTPEITPRIAEKAGLLHQQFISVQGNLRIEAVHAHTVTIKAAKQAKCHVVYSPTVIGGNPDHQAYLQYLIGSYNELAKAQKDRDFRFQVVYNSIQTRFKTHWRQIPLSRFSEAAEFLQAKIDRTLVGRQQKSRGTRCYESFEVFLRNYR